MAASQIMAKDFLTDEEMMTMTGQEVPDFIPDDALPPIEQPPQQVMPSSNEETPSVSEALLRGGAQGATLGFADEIAGGLGAAKSAITEGDLSNLVAKYQQERDLSREAFKQAQEAHPTAFGGAEIATGVGTAFLPPLAALRGVKGAAALGGIAGAGMSEAQDTLGLAKDTLLGAGIGGAAGVAIPAAISGGSKLVGKAGDIASKIGETAQELPIIGEFMKGRALGKAGVDVFTKSGRESAQQEVVDIASKLGLETDKARKVVGAELGALRQKMAEGGKTFDIEEPIKKLENLIETLKNSNDPAAKRDIRQLQTWMDDLKRGKKVQKDISYQKVKPSTEQSIMEKVNKDVAESTEKANKLNQSFSSQIIPSVDDEGNQLISLMKIVDGKPSVKSYKVSPQEVSDMLTETVTAREGAISPKAVPFEQAKDIQSTLTRFGGTRQTPAALKTQEAINVSKLAAKGIGEVVESAPELAASRSQYKMASDAFRALGINPKKDIMVDAVTGQLSLTPQAKSRVASLITSKGKENIPGTVRLQEALKQLRGAAPEAAEQLTPQVSRASDIASVLGDKSDKNILETVKAGGALSGNVVGQVEQKIIKTTKAIANSRALEYLSKTIREKSPNAGLLANQLTELAKSPDLSARMAGVTALMSNPVTKSEIDKYVGEIPKDVEVKTPSVVIGDDNPNPKFDEQYSEEMLTAFQNAITPEMGSAGDGLKNILSTIKEKSPERRKAMMFALEQNPAYRPLLKKLKKVKNGLQ